ncbi:MAG: hypothetical protein JWP05_368 [Microbacteriaceae bacterium]|nr:hypothetical protein [Microbacteriaceae bacterium]MDQ1578514.1 hypothetical protein [Microbacteriaceae bacterium]
MTVLDRIFRISLVLKGLDGLLELVGGVLLLFVSPHQINAVVQFLTQHELSEDPHDFVATHLLSATSNLTTASTLFGAVYLLLHGLVKVLLVVAVLRDKIWAFPWMIGFLIVFIGYQIYQISVAFSIGLILLTVFDAFIVWLTVIEYRKHRRRLLLSSSNSEVRTD